MINAYAQVTSITGSNRVLNLGTVDEANHTFEDGDDIIIMQMQASCIGANTNNNVNFGDISNISAIGRFLVCRIVSHTEVSLVPTSITVQTPINITFAFGATESVQIVSFRKYGSPNYTTVANMTAKNWNGVTGGIIAFQVTNTLTLAHNIIANGAGFRGGAVSTNYYPGGTTCDGTQYKVTTAYTNHGAKGEGIYKTTDNNLLYGRGKLLNGGGGAALINAGGGGGGNYTAGGIGGVGWNNTPTGCSPGVGGLGGIGLGSYVSGSRVFMGGGGGGGQQNDGLGSNGANGGGIIFIKATQIITTGTCGINISANGNTAANGGNDGQGGGGAGGAILVQTNTWNIAGTCPITVSANGGNGGNVNSSLHGGGGGGGQGILIYSVAVPTTNTTNRTNNGVGGCNDSGCTTSAGAGNGTNGTGILGNVPNNLPITLSSFEVTLQNDISNNTQNPSVLIKWGVMTQENNQYFEIEKSQNIENSQNNNTVWVSVGKIDGAGTTNQFQTYQIIDTKPFYGISYYRLKQVDNDGKTTYFPIKDIFIGQTQEIKIYPNPANEKVFIDVWDKQACQISIYNTTGQIIPCKTTQLDTTMEVEIQHLPKGIYLVKIANPKKTITKKIIVQ